MRDNITDEKYIEKVLEREDKRFAEFNCVRQDLTYGTAKHFPLSDRIKWMQTKKQFTAIAPVIQALAQRDIYTAKHSERVALMTYRCCMLIEMSSFYRKKITLTAYCHDIGKISIPDGILNKDGPLTDEEFAEMKEHSQDGANLLEKRSKYTHITQGVLHHHERWDGKGYPAGIKGEEIPFSARVIAIFDSIDAMMSDRPYRKALPEDVCREEIRKNSGIMYEPQLVKICIENWNYIIDGIYNQ